MNALHGFWNTEEGERYKSQQRAGSALRLALPIEPRSKRSNSRAHRDTLAQMIKEDARPWLELRGRFGTTWPRKRAHIALDLLISPNGKSTPRVDSICKWLLDELGGPNSDAIVFNDDKQVKMLFAKKWFRDNEDSIPDPGQTPTSSAHFRKPEPLDPGTIYVTAQRVSLTLDGVRRARDLEPPWDPAKVSGSPFLQSDFEIELDEDYLRRLDPRRSDFEKDESDRLSSKLAFAQQLGFIKSLDYLAALAISELATDQRGIYDWLIGHMRGNPYMFELGSLPRMPGDTARFKARLRQTLTERAQKLPVLFPLRPIVGITVIYFEDGRGKDLDNLVRLAVPEVISELRPPAQDLLYGSSDSHIARQLSDGSGPVDLQFIEAVALGRPPTGVTPGTAFLLLSDGWRSQSWWASALDFEESFYV